MIVLCVLWVMYDHSAVWCGRSMIVVLCVVLVMYDSAVCGVGDV